MNKNLSIAGMFLFLGLLTLWVPLPAAARSPQDRFIRVEASSFAYEPGVITVQKGARVTLELHSRDVVHGLFIDGYGLETRAAPGESNRLTFIADRSGIFWIRCSVTCGALHPFMLGKLKVIEPGFALRPLALTVVLASAVLLLPLSTLAQQHKSIKRDK